MSLTLITESQALIKRDFGLNAASADRVQPSNANAVEQGEFAVIDVTSPRKIGLGVTISAQNKALAFQNFTERGRSDIQAITKLTVLWSHPYEGETDVYDSTGSIAVGDDLTVKIGAQTGVTARLVLSIATSGDLVYGQALNIVPAANLPLGKTVLRFRLFGPTRLVP